RPLYFTAPSSLDVSLLLWDSSSFRRAFLPGRYILGTWKTYRASPYGVLIWKLPPEATATYSCPPISKTMGAALTPAPVWKCQSNLPVRELKASKQPLLSPTKVRP